LFGTGLQGGKAKLQGGENEVHPALKAVEKLQFH
jgi:hypothetical protein